MSRRRELMHQQKKLGEAREIVSAMKSLAFMESRRLARFLAVQRQVVRTMENAAADFLKFHPGYLEQPRSEASAQRQIFLLLGSERGFCGNFNESLLEALDEREGHPQTPDVIACGQKLYSRLEEHPRLITGLAGAAVLDEVPAALNGLVETLTELQRGDREITVSALFHDPEQDQVVTRELLPPFQKLPEAQVPVSHPPQINLAPREFLLALVDQYLFAALHEMLYVSLMAENQQRMQHLEGAVRYLDQNLDDLQRRGNQLRQEEITEEIEVILLSAKSLVPRRGE
ncbi:FoF1 ATP synthase subunit gamma [uncultured Microbulbifer sp.]|uniref:F0F1 ATP synthase subunit gamma n=1 Tax=uncultured Microbulbifer sp. TaxID=348147 RepID=UPI0025E69A68|nr:FoF1 ATP synthase subunit gamma [uncultured Microbulbifer sp.]